jgi:hypothetical protein
VTTPAAPSPTAPLTPQIMRRLAFIQMFFNQSAEQARQPEPLSVTAVLGLHDLTELFFQLASDHLSVALPPFVPYLDYFKLIKNGAGVKLARQREMEGLNRLRVNFKHRGTLPGTTATSDACQDVRRFLEENTQLVFGIAFADIDMAEVIPQQPVADKVRAANAALGSGDLEDAMGLLSEAYEAIFESPGPGRRDRFGRFGDSIQTMSEYDLRAALHPPAGDRTRRPAGSTYQQVATVIAQTANAAAEMQRALRVMALGIDYWQFERFKRLTPSIAYYVNGHQQRRVPPDYAPTADEFGFCRDFIVTTALRVAERQA